MEPSLTTRVQWTGARFKQGLQAIERRMRLGTAPDLLIVGAQKAGTTSLFNYLDARRDFLGAQRKEVRFFNQVERFARGTPWYERHFDGRRSGLHFEATPEYLYHPDAAARIQAHYPNVRIVIILREPVARAYSAWNMYRRWAKAGFMPLVLWQNRHRNPLFYLFLKAPLRLSRITSSMKCDCWPPKSHHWSHRFCVVVYTKSRSRFLNAFGSEHVLVLGFR